jgi:hypothetical protein
MNLPVIDKAFYEMIHQKGIEEKLGVERNYVYQLRNKLKNDIGISMDTKLELLKKSGWKEDAARYTDQDLVKLVNFTLATSAKAKEFGAEYIVEKWRGSKK